jgi:predicted phage terminase large subunit-like protein
MAYMLDVYYTKDPMEVTEPETARRLAYYGVNLARIESNNGGRGFSRNVKRELVENFKNNNVIIKWFHQSKNKNARIFSQSAAVQENILMPVDWAQRWPEYYRAMVSYQKEGKNKHDDAPDMTTGIVEMMEKGQLEYA